MQMKKLTLAALVFWAGATAATAQTPGRTIRLIVPYAAGGPLDITARVLAERVRDTLGPVIVENRPAPVATLGLTQWPRRHPTA